MGNCTVLKLKDNDVMRGILGSRTVRFPHRWAMLDFCLENIWLKSGNNAACTMGNMGGSRESKTIMGCQP